MDASRCCIVDSDVSRNSPLYNMAESSSQALERYLAEQLAGLSLEVPSEDVEFMARFVEEEGLESDEKVEGVKGMLEGVVEVSHARFS